MRSRKYWEYQKTEKKVTGKYLPLQFYRPSGNNIDSNP